MKEFTPGRLKDMVRKSAMKSACRMGSVVAWSYSVICAETPRAVKRSMMAFAVSGGVAAVKWLSKPNPSTGAPVLSNWERMLKL